MARTNAKEKKKERGRGGLKKQGGNLVDNYVGAGRFEKG